MELVDYFQIVGGWLLMLICITGNFAGAYLRSYVERRTATIKRMFVFIVATTLVFCFFFVRKDAKEEVLIPAMVMPIAGIVAGELVVLCWAIATNTRLHAKRLFDLTSLSKLTVTYEMEWVWLVLIQFGLLLKWILTVV